MSVGESGEPFIEYPRAPLSGQEPTAVGEYDALCRAHKIVLWLLVLICVTFAVSRILTSRFEEIRSVDPLEAGSFQFVITSISGALIAARTAVAAFAVVQFNRATRKKYIVLSWVGFVVTLFASIYGLAALCLLGMRVVAVKLKSFGLNPIAIFYRKIDVDFHRMRLAEESEPGPVQRLV